MDFDTMSWRQQFAIETIADIVVSIAGCGYIAWLSIRVIPGKIGSRWYRTAACLFLFFAWSTFSLLLISVDDFDADAKRHTYASEILYNLILVPDFYLWLLCLLAFIVSLSGGFVLSARRFFKRGKKRIEDCERS